MLARKESERTGAIRQKFAHVPYLNSSLFDISNLEDDTLRINSLDDGLKLRISGSTVLKTENGKKVEVINDELIVSTGHNEFFEYKPGNKESQRVQEALFHEKQTLIENCLFGVDINPNSVKICRLRLWIELLKNAYYTPDSKFTELETLPNIDIKVTSKNSILKKNFRPDLEIFALIEHFN